MRKYKLRPGLVLTSICGQALLIATPQARPFCQKATAINATGASIIRLLTDEALSSNEIAVRIATEYELEASVELQRDISFFLEDLQAHGFIVLA